MVIETQVRYRGVNMILDYMNETNCKQYYYCIYWGNLLDYRFLEGLEGENCLVHFYNQPPFGPKPMPFPNPHT